MNVFERTFRDYAALSYNKDDKSEYEKAMEWAANELTRLSALEKKCGDVEGMWISVKERLPEPYVDVLVATVDRAVKSGMHVVIREAPSPTTNRELWRILGSNNYLLGKEISHWMPLPSPPGEEEVG